MIDVAAPCPAKFNLAAHVLAPADAVPDKVALAILGLSGAARWNYRDLRDRVLRSAGGLRAMGLAPGARVLMRLGNDVEFPIAFLAAIAAGLVPVPTSAQLTAPEATALATALQPALIIAGPGIALPEAPACPVLMPDDFASLAAAAPLAPVAGDPDRPAYIVFTSGTSGRPRGVVHAHRAVWARRLMIDGWYGLTRDDRLLHAGAFNWTYTLGTGLLDPWSLGATALIPAAGTPAAALPLLMKRHDATILAAAPGVYRQILRHPMPALPKLRHGLSAGEKLSPAIRAGWQDATGTALHEAFGMSECSTFISGSPTRPAPEGTLGHSQPGRRVAILTPDHAPAPAGTPGTIAVAADDPGLMLGYLDAPGETVARMTADGRWFLTGDTGAMGSDGAITYLGRDDDMMNAGGYRVSPVEVEAALAGHPGIAEAAAVEVRVKADTTVIAAFYTAEAALPEADLAEFAKARLARYKCPKLFVHLDALPRGANNKLSRRLLRETWEAQHGQA